MQTSSELMVSTNSATTMAGEKSGVATQIKNIKTRTNVCTEEYMFS